MRAAAPGGGSKPLPAGCLLGEIAGFERARDDEWAL